jgi:tetratricopeptide (TPR) repeat protein
VRLAAQRALARFGKNAIWQLRERYLNTTGKEADPGWGHQRLLSELARWFEAPKRELVERELARAQAALGRGEFAGAEAALDALLVAVPFGEAAPKLAPLYVRIAGHHEANGQLERALACLRRALRLAPDEAQHKHILARASFLEAELRLAQGQVDLDAYTRALSLDPGLSEAQAVLDELSGKNRERERTRQRVLALLAAAVLAVAGFLALRGRRPTVAEEAASDAAPSV